MENNIDLQTCAQQKKFKEIFYSNYYIQILCMLNPMYSDLVQCYITFLCIYASLIYEYDPIPQFLVYMNIALIYFEQTKNKFKITTKKDEKNFIVIKKIDFTYFSIISVVIKIITPLLILTLFNISMNFQNNLILCLSTWIFFLQSCIKLFVMLYCYFYLKRIPVSIHKYRFTL